MRMLNNSGYIFRCVVYAVISLMTLSSCVKKEADAPCITFGVTGMNVSTKALITDESLNSQTTQVKVYGVRNNTEVVFSDVPITKQSDSYNWTPPSPTQWKSGSYSFYGYTYSGNCNIDNDGLKITVAQPPTYSEADMVDYMLSHAYKVADGNNYHIVMLYMQHAMASAEIVIKQQMPEHNITLNSITLKGIYRSATMECEDQANANSGENNVWKTQISGANDVIYIKEFGTARNEDMILGVMNVLAVPQQLTQSSMLEISYSVDEDNNADTPPALYSQSFNLFNYTPYVWESGHKVRYTLTINTGVELEAEIVDWIQAGYIEGVLLPTETQNQ